MRFSHAGAMHSELNGSQTEPMRFMQFWFLPSVQGLQSSVQQRQYTRDDRADTLLQIMGPEGEDGLDLAQDARVWVSSLSSGAPVERQFGEGRGGYLYVMDGSAGLGGDKLGTHDAAKVFGPQRLTITAIDDAELILIDVPLEFEPVGVWAGRP
jgi:redox-sensitive bicupin YhaK (pirin superfamily)